MKQKSSNYSILESTEKAELPIKKLNTANCTSNLSVLVLHDTPLTRLGGAERVCLFLTKGLSERGYKVILLSPKSHEHGGFPFFKEIRDHYHYFFPTKKRMTVYRGIIYRYKLLSSILRHFKVDVLVTTGRADLVTAFLSKQLGIPTVVYVHWPLKPTPFHPRGSLKKLYYLPLEIFLVFSSRFLDGVSFVCNSNFTSDAVEKIWKFEVKTIITPPIDLNFFKPDWDKKEENLILIVGRVASRKRFELAINVYRLLKERLDNIRMIVAGFMLKQPKYLAYLERIVSLADDLDVEFRWNVSDEELLDLYQRAGVLLFPSTGEYFGLIPLEAMACGAPVVAFDEGGSRETIVDGETGFLCKDFKEFYEKVLLLLKDEKLRSFMGRKAVEHARYFSFERFLSMMEKVIHETAGLH